MKKSVRAIRFPRNFAPCSLSSRLTADHSLVVEFTFPPNLPDATHWAIGIVEAAEALGLLFRHFTQHLDRREREIQTDARRPTLGACASEKSSKPIRTFDS